MKRSGFMKLETDRLIIVPCTKQTMTSDYPCGPHIIQHLHALKEDPALLYWGVWLVKRKADDKIIGDMGFKGRPDENKTAEVSYGFLESCWNKV